MKIAIYTCITGGYDKLCSPIVIDPRFEYFYFSDSSSDLVPPWIFKQIDISNLNQKDKNRYIKMHPQEFFQDYDVTVYIDGSIKLIGDIYPLILRALSSSEDIFMYQHPHRNCIFTEALACSNYSHDWIWTIASQMRRYAAEGYPVNKGLFEAGVIIRKNSLKSNSLMSMWWREYLAGVKRDQISLPVCAWRLGFELGSLGESDPRFGHRYFKFVDHPPGRNIKMTIRRYINKLITLLVPREKLFNLKNFSK